MPSGSRCDGKAGVGKAEWPRKPARGRRYSRTLLISGSRLFWTSAPGRRQTLKRQVQGDRQAQVVCGRAHCPLIRDQHAHPPRSLCSPTSRAWSFTSTSSTAALSLLRSRPDSWLAERPKCTGLHALRHFYASWCINRPQDGGPRSTAQGATRAMGPFLDHHDV